MISMMILQLNIIKCTKTEEANFATRDDFQQKAPQTDVLKNGY